MKVHDQVEEGGILESIVEGGEPRTGGPSHDVTLLVEKGSLVRETRKEREGRRKRGEERGWKRERERERERENVRCVVSKAIKRQTLTSACCRI